MITKLLGHLTSYLKNLTAEGDLSVSEAHDLTSDSEAVFFYSIALNTSQKRSISFFVL